MTPSTLSTAYFALLNTKGNNQQSEAAINNATDEILREMFSQSEDRKAFEKSWGKM